MKRIGPLFLILVAFSVSSAAKSVDWIVIEGDYLFYSFDYNYVFGKGNIRVTLDDFLVRAQRIEMDINDRNAFFTQDCQLDFKGKNYLGDCIDLDMEKSKVRLLQFGEQYTSVVLPESQEPEPAFNEFVPVSLQELKKSLVYFVGKRLVIRKNYAVIGYQVTVFLEGMPSVSLRKFRLDKGIVENKKNLFQIDKIWYYSAQGMVFNSSFNLEKKGKKHLYTHATSLETQYDLFGLSGASPKGRIYLNSRQEWSLSERLLLRGNFNWITQNMLHGSLGATQRIGQSITNEWLLEYNKPYTRKEELWFRLRSSMPLKAWGNFNFNLSYEKQGQNVFDFFYGNQLFKKLNVSLRHNQSKLLYDQSNSNRLSNSSFTLSYSTKIFNLSADYSLNRDLLHDQSQANPTLRLQFNPFKLYGGLLRVNFMSTAMLNYFRKGDFRDYIFRSNSALSLDTEKFSLFPGSEISASLAMEQFLDEDPQNRFTTLGCIFRGKKDIANMAFLEVMYNYQTRRETGRGFIQGTHSQDCNLVLRLNEKRNFRINGWTSVSMDTKRGRLTTGYLDVSVFLIKNWRWQTQVNYDFQFRHLSYDFYLIRKAGRFMLRISYRSLSKGFQLELLPQ